MPLGEALDTALRLQIGGCRHWGSELYARLLEHVREDCLADGPCGALLDAWPGDPLRGFLPLRLLAAVHARVLAGAAPELAAHYPTAGGTPSWPGVWEAFLGVVTSQEEALRPALGNFPQTNEVRRCAGLLGGFLEIARSHPDCRLALRELGASAGLNLGWDRYRYVLGDHRWGEPDSPVEIRAEWSGPAAAFDRRPGVESRAGCDLAPVRVERHPEVYRLESYVWPDQPERLEQIRGAVALAQAEPPRLDTARAGDWLEEEIRTARPGIARVVFHSSMWLYLDEAEQERVVGLLEEHGRSARADAPLAWLRHEDSETRPGHMELRLRLWPGGRDRKLADGHPHGRRVAWLDG